MRNLTAKKQLAVQENMVPDTIQPDSIYQLKITLKWLDPPIWRRVLVPAGITLSKLHQIIQTSMGWENAHQHYFFASNITFGMPESECLMNGEQNVEDERKTTLSQIAPAAGIGFLYEYDLGDGWIHDVQVENILTQEPDQYYPFCIAGERACPPEDCGGPYGYIVMLNALFDSNYPDRQHTLDWLDANDFNPEMFDLIRANAALHGIK